MMFNAQQKRANELAHEIKAISIASSAYAIIRNAVSLERQYQKQLPSSQTIVV
jgi:hypothetical protein